MPNATIKDLLLFLIKINKVKNKDINKREKKNIYVGIPSGRSIIILIMTPTHEMPAKIAGMSTV
jgi:hypothetical protein